MIAVPQAGEWVLVSNFHVQLATAGSRLVSVHRRDSLTRRGNASASVGKRCKPRGPAPKPPVLYPPQTSPLMPAGSLIRFVMRR